MGLDEKVQAVWMVQMEKERQADVAKHFRVTQQTISTLICTVRKKPGLLSELLALRKSAQKERAEVREIVLNLIEENQVIDSFEALAKLISKKKKSVVKT